MEEKGGNVGFEVGGGGGGGSHCAKIRVLTRSSYPPVVG